MKLAPIAVLALFAACAACDHRHAPAPADAGPADAGRDGGADGGFYACGPWYKLPPVDAGPQGELLVSPTNYDLGDHWAESDLVAYSYDQIYLVRLSTNEERRILLPRPYLFGGDPVLLDGRVYWRASTCTDRSPCTDILSVDLSTCALTRLAVPTSFKSSLRGSGNWLVWTDNGNNTGPNDDIYGYDLDAGAAVRLVTDPGNQLEPTIDGKWVAYVDDNSGGIAYLNLDDRVVRHVTAPAWQEKPSISGDRIVWVDWRNATADPNNADIYMLTISTGVVEPVTTNPAIQDEPFIWGDLVAYTDTRNGSFDGVKYWNSDIYVTDLRTRTEWPLVTARGDTATSPGNQGGTFIWSGGYLWSDGRAGLVPSPYWRPMP